MTEDKVILDRKSFEALAVESRVKILKSLKQRRKTLSEIAKERGMSVSGIKEHLETLEGAGLVRKLDDGHKWKYYELTQKGGELLTPKEIRVWVLLSISTIALLSSLLAIFYASTTPLDGVASIPEGPDIQAEDSRIMAASPLVPGIVMQNETVEKATPPQTEENNTIVEPDLRMPIAVASVSAATTIACIFILWHNHQRSKSST